VGEPAGPVDGAADPWDEEEGLHQQVAGQTEAETQTLESRHGHAHGASKIGHGIPQSRMMGLLDSAASGERREAPPALA